MISVLFTLTLSTFSGCNEIGSVFKNNMKSSLVLEDVRIAYTNQPQSALIHIALEKGYFKDEGLNIISVKTEYGKAALQAVNDDKADIATVAETPIVFSIFESRPINVLVTMVTSQKNNAVLARRNAGINKFRDLIGKKIGYTPLTTADFFLDSLLTANGLNRKDVKAVPMEPAELSAAFLNSKIDAIVYWNYPMAEMRKTLGNNAIQFYDQEIYTETFNLVSKSEFAKNNQEKIKKVIKSLIRALDFTEKKPEESYAIMAKRTERPVELIAEVWKYFDYNISLDNTIKIALEDEARWAIKNKYTSANQMPDFSKIINNKALEELKPQLYKKSKL